MESCRVSVPVSGWRASRRVWEREFSPGDFFSSNDFLAAHRERREAVEAFVRRQLERELGAAEALDLVRVAADWTMPHELGVAVERYGGLIPDGEVGRLFHRARDASARRAVELLLTRDADVNQRDERGELHWVRSDRQTLELVAPRPSSDAPLPFGSPAGLVGP